MGRIAVVLAWLAASLAVSGAHAAGILRPLEFVPGLDGARAVVASADGQHVYVASTAGGVGAITTFRRMPDGRVVDFGEIRDGVASVTGLADVRRLAFRPGGVLYFASPSTGTLSAYQRDAVMSTLTGGVLTEGLSGAVDAAAATTGGTHYYVASELGALFVIDAFGEIVQSLSDGFGGIDGIGGAAAVVVTPDEGFVYVYGASDGQIAGFARAGDGTLAPIAGSPFEARLDGDALAVSPDGRFLALACASCDELRTFSIDAVTGALAVTGAATVPDVRDVAFADDGRRAIVAGDGRLGVFDRDPATGDIEFLDALEDGIGGVNGLAGARDVEPLGFFADTLYVASSGDGALASFDVAALRYLGRLQDGEPPVTGLGGAASAVVSPDGVHVYAGGSTEDTVAILERSPTDGTLEWLGEIREGVAGAQGLDGANAAAMSPDGKHLFVLGGVGNSVASYGRNAINGALAFESMLTSANGLAGLSGPFDADVSADGRHLYVAGLLDGSVWVLGYGAVSGALSFVQQASDVFGLINATAVAVSPEGSHVYATGRSLIGLDVIGSIAVFSRNAATGALTRTGLLQDGVGGVTGLEGGPTGVAVSPDGRFVYAAGGSGDGALTIFARNVSTGALTQTDTLRDGTTADCLGGVYDLAISPDGDFVHSIATNDAAVCLFARDSTSGALLEIEARFQGVDGVDGLAGAAGIAVAADGRNAYVTSSTAGALAQFQTPVATAPEPMPALLGAAALAALATTSRRGRSRGSRSGRAACGTSCCAGAGRDCARAAWARPAFR